MLDELHGSKVFSKIVLRCVYHEIRMKEGDKWRTPFEAKYGLCECMSCLLVYLMFLPPLCRLINKVLRHLIEKFMVL